MASLARRLPANVPGSFFVDDSCIDCDACRIVAPATFADRGGQSAVVAQPSTAAELLAAQMALLTCPTASIGDAEKRSVDEAQAALPALVAEDVYWCGYNAESSFGAFSYLVVRDEGNLLIDSPRFTTPLVRQLERLGGVSTILLTHRDDVADHEKFASHFGAGRVLHADDVSRSTAGVERKLEGSEPVRLTPDLLALPVPGHTRGHVVYLYRDRFLFSGDHLAWNARRETLYAFRSACWYSWNEQTKSMRSLLPYRFEFLLPGHGRPITLPAEEMQAHLVRCVAWMESFS